MEELMKHIFTSIFTLIFVLLVTAVPVHGMQSMHRAAAGILNHVNTSWGRVASLFGHSFSTFTPKIKTEEPLFLPPFSEEVIRDVEPENTDENESDESDTESADLPTPVDPADRTGLLDEYDPTAEARKAKKASK